jgi:hypothetical protein
MRDARVHGGSTWVSPWRVASGLTGSGSPYVNCYGTFDCNETYNNGGGATNSKTTYTALGMPLLLNGADALMYVHDQAGLKITAHNSSVTDGGTQYNLVQDNASSVIWIGDSAGSGTGTGVYWDVSNAGASIHGTIKTLGNGQHLIMADNTNGFNFQSGSYLYLCYDNAMATYASMSTGGLTFNSLANNGLVNFKSGSTMNTYFGYDSFHSAQQADTALVYGTLNISTGTTLGVTLILTNSTPPTGTTFNPIGANVLGTLTGTFSSVPAFWTQTTSGEEIKLTV